MNARGRAGGKLGRPLRLRPLLGLALLPLASLGGSVAGAAYDSTNPVSSENQRDGTAAWMGPFSSSARIEGYASEVSVLPGETVHFHVASRPAGPYAVDIYRLGWYGGLGGRLVASVDGTAQARPRSSGATGAGWPVTSEVAVPGDWVSGYYLARFRGPGSDTGATVFVVRAPASRAAPILIQVPVNTWQAYNPWGGKSLYEDNSAGGRGDRVSFERPFAPGYLQPLEWELHLVRFLEREGYDVAYQTDVDTHRDPESLLRYRLVIVAGHGEYWTSRMRDAFDRARDLGTNLAFFGANISYWQIRYENGERTIVAYKSPADPEQDPALRTVLFRELGRPECQLLGVMHQGGMSSGYAPSLDFTARASPDDPWISQTGLTPGAVVPGVVGPEWDTLPDAPPSGCSKPSLKVLFDYEGPPIGAQSIRYVADSGARVFSAGSLRFAWGLDAFAPPTQGRPTTPVPALQQFVRNMLADLMRPAAPASVTATPRGAGTLRLRIARPADPRVSAIVVRRDSMTVCETTGGECLDQGLPGHRSYSYSAIAQDRWSESQPATFGPFLLPNSPPAAVLRGPHRTRQGRRLTFVVRTVDRDGDVLSFSWALDGHAIRDTRRHCSVVFRRMGRHIVSVTVRDAYRGIAARRAVVFVV